MTFFLKWVTLICFPQVSIGIERLFSIMEANMTKQEAKIRTVDTQVRFGLDIMFTNKN